MQYDPIKQRLGAFVGSRPLRRKLFYRALDLLLLRTWHVHRALKAFAMERQTNESCRVLDAGSGFGQYSWFMARRFPSWQIHAIDLKDDEIKTSRDFFKQAGYTQLTAEVQDLLTFCRPDSYALILSVDVMEHIEDDRKVFRNFFESLSEGGMLLISTPSDEGGSGVHHEGETSFIEEHVRDGYGVAEITEKLQEAGFQQIEARYTYGRPGHISWLLSMKLPIQLLGISRLFFILLPLYYLLVMPMALLLNFADLAGNHKTGTGLLVKDWKSHTAKAIKKNGT